MLNDHELYYKFNQKIYDTYFSGRYDGETFVLMIDDYFIKNLCGELAIKQEELISSISISLRNQWEESIVTYNKEVPSYLGFIGIAIFAAYQMEDSEEEDGYTAAAYYPQFKKLLNRNIYRVFKEIYAWKVLKHIEPAWEELRDWSAKKDIDLCIPLKKEGKNRYVQYPLSQALLNKKDLKNLPSFFKKCSLKLGEKLTLENFISIIKPIKYNSLGTRFYKLYCENDKRNSILKQLFNFYQNWDGEDSILNRNRDKKDTEKSVTAKSKTQPKQLFLTVKYSRKDCNTGDIKFIVVDDCDNLQKEYPVKDLFKTLKDGGFRTYWPSKSILIFEADDDYRDEWNECRYIRPESKYLVITDSAYWVGNFDKMNCEIKKIDEYSFICLSFDDLEKIPDNILKYFTKKYPVKTINGLRLYGTTWLYGAGPDITADDPDITVRLNGDKIPFEEYKPKEYKFSCRDCKPGTYNVKPKDAVGLEFTIENPSIISPDTTKKGWCLNRKSAKWMPESDEPNLKGLFFKQCREVESRSMIIEWIKANRYKNLKDDIALPSVIRNIRRAK